jgi:hypothetical protein
MWLVGELMAGNYLRIEQLFIVVLGSSFKFGHEHPAWCERHWKRQVLLTPASGNLQTAKCLLLFQILFQFVE